jgi:hypothetical protein
VLPGAITPRYGVCGTPQTLVSTTHPVHMPMCAYRPRAKGAQEHLRMPQGVLGDTRIRVGWPHRAAGGGRVGG